MKLKQNTLEEATTTEGFLEALNGNADETVISLEREVELPDGTVVLVEGVTPEAMKNALNSLTSEDVITFKTPGENYIVNNEVLVDGVCQAYNETVEEEPVEEPDVTIPFPSQFELDADDCLIASTDKQLIDRILSFGDSQEDITAKITQGENEWDGIIVFSAENSFDFFEGTGETDDNVLTFDIISNDQEEPTHINFCIVNGFEDLTGIPEIPQDDNL